jgi:hypothetical protein
MTGKIIEVLIMESVAAVMLWFAYAIGVKGRMELIAGYNQRSAEYVHDKPGLARLVGRVCLLIGVATALMPVATAIWGTSHFGFWVCMGVYGGFLAGAVALTALQSRDFVSGSARRTTDTSTPGHQPEP